MSGPSHAAAGGWEVRSRVRRRPSSAPSPRRRARLLKRLGPRSPATRHPQPDSSSDESSPPLARLGAPSPRSGGMSAVAGSGSTGGAGGMSGDGGLSGSGAAPTAEGTGGSVAGTGGTGGTGGAVSSTGGTSGGSGAPTGGTVGWTSTRSAGRLGSSMTAIPRTRPTPAACSSATHRSRVAGATRSTGTARTSSAGYRIELAGARSSAGRLASCTPEASCPQSRP